MGPTQQQRESPTIGQKELDKAVGKEYLGWVTNGVSDFNKNLAQLEWAKGMLAARLQNKGGNLTGSFVGRLPEGMKTSFFPDAVATRDAVQEVIQRNLKLILGGSFSEAEAAALIARAYNENLGEEENLRRLNNLTLAMKEGLASKNSLMDYFAQHGTVAGWHGKKPSVSDFTRALTSGTGEGKNDPQVTIIDGVRIERMD
jgi:hypothetical protein